jgi:hypothetical protein
MSEDLPKDFNHLYYWYFNNDLKEHFNKDDNEGLINHWLKHGKNENRRYSIPQEILQKFNHLIYYLLHDDLKEHFGENDYDSLLNHYIMFGINENRCCSIDEITLPNDFFTNNTYTNLNNINNFNPKYALPNNYKLKINYYKNQHTNTNLSDKKKLNLIPYDFNYLYYWCLNEDIRNEYDKNDKENIIKHWIMYGHKENREYNFPINIIKNFDHKIYYLLYNDIQQMYNCNDYDNMIVHYYLFGKKNNRICSIDEIIIPYDFNTNVSYDKYKNLTNFQTPFDIPYLYKIKINYFKLSNDCNV